MIGPLFSTKKVMSKNGLEPGTLKSYLTFDACCPSVVCLICPFWSKCCDFLLFLGHVINAGQFWAALGSFGQLSEIGWAARRLRPYMPHCVTMCDFILI